MPDYEAIKEMVDAIQDRAIGVTDWETKFIESIVGQWKMKGYLSPNQIAQIDKIYKDRCPESRGELRFKAISGAETAGQRATDRFRNEGRDDFSGASGRRRLAREKGYDD